jgi:Uma2 family endonuclease
MASFVKGSERRMQAPAISALRDGERLDQKTFHERYEATPEHVRAELIGGIVYIASPQKTPHSRGARFVTRWLDEYGEATPGTECLPGVTNILGAESEPEPDHCLLVLPDFGGQTWENDRGYLAGSPELIVETSWATEARDLHQKKDDYEKAQVREYVVVALRSQKVFWFGRRGGKFAAMRPGRDGILRSRAFPGLWLDPTALLQNDRARLLAVLREGLASAEHAAFVAKITARKRKRGAK